MKTRWRYGHGVISITEFGTYSAYVSLGHAGKRRRRSFKTLADAKTWIDTEVPVGAVMSADAINARSILPDAVTLVDAARFWNENHTDIVVIGLTEAFSQFVPTALLTAKQSTVSGYGAILRRMVEKTGDIAVASLSPQVLADYLDTLPGASRNSAIRSLSPFLAWCVSKHYCSANVAALQTRAKLPKKTPSVLQIGEAESLMRRAERDAPNIVPWIALGLFAGLRPREAHRVRSEHILDGFIRLTADITKDADARTVPVQGNLASWLAAYPLPTRGVSESAVKRFKARTGMTWCADGLRHSYATYRYELTHDAAATAAELGHAGTEVFFTHYRALARPGSGAEFFAIYPAPS